MRAKRLLLEISQDDLDIMAAAVTERHAALKDVSSNTERLHPVSGEYSSGSGQVCWRGRCQSVKHGHSRDVGSMALASLIRLPPALFAARCHISEQALSGRGVRVDGSTLLVDVTRLRLPFPLGLVDVSFQEIRFAGAHTGCTALTVSDRCATDVR